MSQDYDMLDKPIETAVDLIMAGNGISESIDAVILENDLTPGETRAIIYFMAQKGYRYTNKGA